MKRFPGPLRLAAFGFVALAASAFAGETPATPVSGHGPGGRSLRHLEHCLSALDLSADQQAAVRGILASGKTTLQADGQALKADHLQLQTDLANGVDKSALGQDVLNQSADMTKMKAHSQAIHDQILASLPADLQENFSTCAAAPSGRGMSWRPHGGQ